ncbi:Heme A synthase [Commensalibacter sp. Nvir]|uniref:COX15/CtaA family protein n=1 Tax=Commensalibacter sp. Nvir TaxID=3069817 RepID=UPI002D3A848D|nr:Heme A synthase [Commensalibacter sp. Nvir]
MKNSKIISNWLFLICFLLLGMIVLGGYTRLSGSGLSIMDWKPVTGIIPPLNHQEWVREFNLYKTIPQYTILNKGFGLDGFKQIFWAEWSHRFLGRLIGIVLFIPLIYFLIKKMISKPLAIRLFIFFILGGLQGSIGWFMVYSGFQKNSIAVEPIRLVLHLSFALMLYAAILWTALSVQLSNFTPTNPKKTSKFLRILLYVDSLLLTFTIIAGGFTAGTHAGRSFNTFPLMSGKIFPDGYNQFSPFWLNWVENIAAIQFNHRLLATLTTIAIFATIYAGWKTNADNTLKKILISMGWTVFIQYLLGITTLLLVVPIWAGTIHQGVAIILLTIVIIALHCSSNPKAILV